MSHKNYGGYFKKDESREEAKVSYDEKREEVQTTEPITETPREETEAEEQKVEAPKPQRRQIDYASVIGGKPCKMRFKPDKKAQVINIIPHRAKVVILEDLGAWWKVSYKGIRGFMMSEFLKKE